MRTKISYEKEIERLRAEHTELVKAGKWLEAQNRRNRIRLCYDAIAEHFPLPTTPGPAHK